MDELKENILAEYLDSREDPRISVSESWDDYPLVDEELRSYIDLVKEINRVSEIAPTAEFMNGAAKRLVRKLNSRKSSNPILAFWFALSNPRPVQFSRSPVFIVAIALVILIGLSTGTAYASTNSIPGDALYPVKLQVENAQLTLSSGEDKIKLDLAFSARRMGEVTRLLALGKYDLAAETILASQAKIAEAQEMASSIHPDKGGKQQLLLEQVSDQRYHNLEVLKQVLGKVPVAAQDGILNAIDNSGKKPGQQNNEDQGKGNQQIASPEPATPDIPGLLNKSRTPPGLLNNHGGLSPNNNQSSPSSPPGLVKKTATPESPSVNQPNASQPNGAYNMPGPQKTRIP